jgi:hypothetical protein
MWRHGALLFLAAWCSCKPSVSGTDCDAMLDRYLDMTEDDDPALKGMTGEPRAGVRAERIAIRRASLAYLEAEHRCITEVTRAEHACAMKASSANDWEACITP